MALISPRYLSFHIRLVVFLFSFPKKGKVQSRQNENINAFAFAYMYTSGILLQKTYEKV